MSSSSIGAAAAAGTSLTAIHPDIVQSHILNRLDGTDLASTSCASVHFQSLCNEDQLWQRICNSTWPSTAHPAVRSSVSAFPSAHRSLYSDSFPSFQNCIDPHRRDNTCSPETSELISAVDIYYDNKPLYSKVLRTETLSSWFMSSPFRLELLNPKETIPTPPGGACKELAKERLRVSWILIDPANKRAVNVASKEAVEARLLWINEDLQLRYATVTSDSRGNSFQCAVVVNCGGAGLQVKEVSMQVEDMEGKIVGGRDSLVILRGAMDGERRRSDVDMEREIHELFRRNKEDFRERKLRREKGLDMAFIATGLSFFLCFIYFLFTLHLKS